LGRPVPSRCHRHRSTTTILRAAREALEETHAFNEPNSADRLVLPRVLQREGSAEVEFTQPPFPASGIGS
jgi:hypothetical protein